jgi:lactoylglutathione lyase
MKIEHIALWTKDLERLRIFYERYFHVKVGEKYINPKRQFESYFLSFEDGCRLELMQMPTVPDSNNDIYQQFTGFIHFAVSTGSKEKVDELTHLLKQDGYKILDGPRTTGDGYYESVVLDPDNNRVEITI